MRPRMLVRGLKRRGAPQWGHWKRESQRPSGLAVIAHLQAGQRVAMAASSRKSRRAVSSTNARRTSMIRRIAAAAVAVLCACAHAQDVKIGVIAPFTGPAAGFGKQIEAGMRAYLKIN